MISTEYIFIIALSTFSLGLSIFHRLRNIADMESLDSLEMK